MRVTAILPLVLNLFYAELASAAKPTVSPDAAAPSGSFPSQYFSFVLSFSENIQKGSGTITTNGTGTTGCGNAVVRGTKALIPVANSAAFTAAGANTVSAGCFKSLTNEAMVADTFTITALTNLQPDTSAPAMHETAFFSPASGSYVQAESKITVYLTEGVNISNGSAFLSKSTGVYQKIYEKEVLGKGAVSVTKTFPGRVVFSPTSLKDAGAVYTLSFEAGAFVDYAGNYVPASSDSTMLFGTGLVVKVSTKLDAVVPGASATDVLKTASVILTFADYTYPSTASIALCTGKDRTASDGYCSEKVEIGADRMITVGKSIIVNPESALSDATLYRLSIPDGAFSYYKGLSVPTGSDASEWPYSFTTAAAETADTVEPILIGKMYHCKADATVTYTACDTDGDGVVDFHPQLYAVDPIPETQGIPVGTKFQAWFDEPVTRVNPKALEATLVDDTMTPTKLAVSATAVGSTEDCGVTVEPTLVQGRAYTLTIPAGSLKDGAPKANIYKKDIQFKFFTSLSTAPVFHPLATDGVVEFDAPVSVTFHAGAVVRPGLGEKAAEPILFNDTATAKTDFSVKINDNNHVKFVGNKLIVIPPKGLVGGKEYEVTIPAFGVRYLTRTLKFKLKTRVVKVTAPIVLLTGPTGKAASKLSLTSLHTTMYTPFVLWSERVYGVPGKRIIIKGNGNKILFRINAEDECGENGKTTKCVKFQGNKMYILVGGGSIASPGAWGVADTSYTVTIEAGTFSDSKYGRKNLLKTAVPNITLTTIKAATSGTTTTATGPAVKTISPPFSSATSALNRYDETVKRLEVKFSKKIWSTMESTFDPSKWLVHRTFVAGTDTVPVCGIDGVVSQKLGVPTWYAVFDQEMKHPALSASSSAATDGPINVTQHLSGAHGSSATAPDQLARDFSWYKMTNAADAATNANLTKQPNYAAGLSAYLYHVQKNVLMFNAICISTSNTDCAIANIADNSKYADGLNVNETGMSIITQNTTGTWRISNKANSDNGKLGAPQKIGTTWMSTNTTAGATNVFWMTTNEFACMPSVLAMEYGYWFDSRVNNTAASAGAFETAENAFVLQAYTDTTAKGKDTVTFLMKLAAPTATDVAASAAAGVHIRGLDGTGYDATRHTDSRDDLANYLGLDFSSPHQGTANTANVTAKAGLGSAASPLSSTFWWQTNVMTDTNAKIRQQVATSVLLETDAVLIENQSNPKLHHVFRICHIQNHAKDTTTAYLYFGGNTMYYKAPEGYPRLGTKYGQFLDHPVVMPHHFVGTAQLTAAQKVLALNDEFQRYEYSLEIKAGGVKDVATDAASVLYNSAALTPKKTWWCGSLDKAAPQLVVANFLPASNAANIPSSYVPVLALNEAVKFFWHNSIRLHAIVLENSINGGTIAALTEADDALTYRHMTFGLKSLKDANGASNKILVGEGKTVLMDNVAIRGNTCASATTCAMPAATDGSLQLWRQGGPNQFGSSLAPPNHASMEMNNDKDVTDKSTWSPLQFATATTTQIRYRPMTFTWAIQDAVFMDGAGNPNNQMVADLTRYKFATVATKHATEAAGKTVVAQKAYTNKFEEAVQALVDLVPAFHPNFTHTHGHHKVRDGSNNTVYMHASFTQRVTVETGTSYPTFEVGTATDWDGTGTMTTVAGKPTSDAETAKGGASTAGDPSPANSLASAGSVTFFSDGATATIVTNRVYQVTILTTKYKSLSGVTTTGTHKLLFRVGTNPTVTTTTTAAPAVTAMTIDFTKCIPAHQAAQVDSVKTAASVGIYFASTLARTINNKKMYVGNAAAASWSAPTAGLHLTMVPASTALNATNMRAGAAATANVSGIEVQTTSYLDFLDSHIQWVDTSGTYTSQIQPNGQSAFVHMEAGAFHFTAKTTVASAELNGSQWYFTMEEADKVPARPLYASFTGHAAGGKVVVVWDEAVKLTRVGTVNTKGVVINAKLSSAQGSLTGAVAVAGTGLAWYDAGNKTEIPVAFDSSQDTHLWVFVNLDAEEDANNKIHSFHDLAGNPAEGTNVTGFTFTGTSAFVSHGMGFTKMATGVLATSVFTRSTLTRCDDAVVFSATTRLNAVAKKHLILYEGAVAAGANRVLLAKVEATKLLMQQQGEATKILFQPPSQLKAGATYSVDIEAGAFSNNVGGVSPALQEAWTTVLSKDSDAPTVIMTDTLTTPYKATGTHTFKVFFSEIVTGVATTVTANPVSAVGNNGGSTCMADYSKGANDPRSCPKKSLLPCDVACQWTAATPAVTGTLAISKAVGTVAIPALLAGKGYALKIEQNAVKDLAGNTNAEIGVVDGSPFRTLFASTETAPTWDSAQPLTINGHHDAASGSLVHHVRVPLSAIATLTLSETAYPGTGSFHIGTEGIPVADAVFHTTNVYLQPMKLEAKKTYTVKADTKAVQSYKGKNPPALPASAATKFTTLYKSSAVPRFAAANSGSSSFTVASARRLAPTTLRKPFDPSFTNVNVSLRTSLAFTFSEPVTKGAQLSTLQKAGRKSAAVTVDDLSDSSTAFTIDFNAAETAANGYVFDGSSVYLHSSTALSAEKEYAVSIFPNTFLSVKSSLPFPGGYRIASFKTTTVDATAPTLLASSPAADATGVSTSTNMWLYLSERVTASTLATGTATLGVAIPVNNSDPSSGSVQVYGSMVFVDAFAELDYNTAISFSVSSSAFTDYGGQALATANVSFTTFSLTFKNLVKDNQTDKLTDHFPAREGMIAVHTAGKMLVYGGKDAAGSTCYDDAYTSLDGIKWTPVTQDKESESPGGVHLAPHAVDSEGCLVVIGGQCRGSGTAKIHKTCDAGKLWTVLPTPEMTPEKTKLASPFPTAFKNHLIAFAGGWQLVIVDFERKQVHQAQNAELTQWTTVSSSLPVPSRVAGTMLATSEGALRIVGGHNCDTSGSCTNNDVSTDVWESEDVGVTWTCVTANYSKDYPPSDKYNKLWSRGAGEGVSITQTLDDAIWLVGGQYANYTEPTKGKDKVKRSSDKIWVSSQAPLDTVFNATPLLQIPAAGATGVDKTQNITMYFDETIVRGDVEKEIKLEQKSGTEPYTHPKTTVKIKGNTLFVGHGALLPNVQYQVVIPDGSLLDLAGNKIASFPTYTITTKADVAKPTMALKYPATKATGVSPWTTIVLTANEDVAAGSDYKTALVKLKPAAGPEVSINISAFEFSGRDMFASLPTDARLIAGQTYTVMSDANCLMDKAGNDMAKNTSLGTFTVLSGSTSSAADGYSGKAAVSVAVPQPLPTKEGAEVDEAAPVFKSVVPAIGATDVPQTGPIAVIITLNEPVKFNLNLAAAVTVTNEFKTVVASLVISKDATPFSLVKNGVKIVLPEKALNDPVLPAPAEGKTAPVVKGKFTVDIPEGLITDARGNAYTHDAKSQITFSTLRGQQDKTAPVVVMMSPSNSASGVPGDLRNVSVFFSEDIAIKDAKAVVKMWKSDKETNDLTLGDKKAVTIAGPKMTLTLAEGALGKAGAWVFILPAAAITDVTRGKEGGLIDFAGLTTKAKTWKFTTANRDVKAPTLTTARSPEHETEAKHKNPVTRAIKFVWSEAVFPVEGEIVLTPTFGKETIKIDVTDKEHVTIHQSQVLIAPPSPLAGGEIYKVTFPKGLFKDAAGNLNVAALATYHISTRTSITFKGTVVGMALDYPTNTKSSKGTRLNAGLIVPPSTNDLIVIGGRNATFKAPAGYVNAVHNDVWKLVTGRGVNCASAPSAKGKCSSEKCVKDKDGKINMGYSSQDVLVWRAPRNGGKACATSDGVAQSTLKAKLREKRSPCDCPYCLVAPVGTDENPLPKNMPNETYVSAYKTIQAFDKGAERPMACNEGYTPSGPWKCVVKDLFQGKWETPFPKCVPAACGKTPSAPEGATLGKECVADSAHDTKCAVTCASGFITPTKTMTCQFGKWSTASPCAKKQCEIPEVANGSLKCTSQEFGSECTVECQAGYIVSGTAATTCATKDATKPDELPVFSNVATCKKRSCADLTGALAAIDANAVVKTAPTSTEYGSVATVTCGAGYAPTTDLKYKCEATDSGVSWKPVSNAVSCTKATTSQKTDGPAGTLVQPVILGDIKLGVTASYAATPEDLLKDAPFANAAKGSLAKAFGHAAILAKHITLTKAAAPEAAGRRLADMKAVISYQVAVADADTAKEVAAAVDAKKADMAKTFESEMTKTLPEAKVNGVSLTTPKATSITVTATTTTAAKSGSSGSNAAAIGGGIGGGIAALLIIGGVCYYMKKKKKDQE